MKIFKYRLYPTKAQVEKIEWILARCCELYNAALQERKESWNACKKHPSFYDPVWYAEHAKDYRVTYYDQTNALPELKGGLRPEYAAIGSQVLQDVLRRVDKAFQNFFRRVTCGQVPGYPRYQSRTQYASFCYPGQSGWKLNGNRLRLTGIGTIKVKLHRGVQGTVKTCTIKREGRNWYLALACEVEAEPRLPYTDLAVGIDLGLLHFATLSTGDTIENPRYFRHAEKRLQRKQQALSRKKRGSKRRKKAAQEVGKCHRKVCNQRKNFLHKEARNLVNCYETIVFEDLKLKNMSRRPQPKQDSEGMYLPNGAAAKGGLNKSLADVAWGWFVRLVCAKAESAGHTRVVLVNPKDTSQVCSGCLRKGPHKDLDERTHTCEHCGLVLDRDHNAACNILRLGRSLQEQS
jgi:putative transposase